MNILGLIEIEKKTDVLAFTAFIISILTAVYQIGLFVIGPNAKLLVPEGITMVRFDDSPPQPYISVIAPISIANTSGAQEPLLLLRQTAVVQVGDRTIPLTWHDIIEAPISGGTIKFDNSKAVSPFIIDTKKVSSNLIRFTPQRKPCEPDDTDCKPNQPFVSFEEFRSLYLKATQDGTKFFEVRLSAEFDNHKPVHVSCKIPMMLNHVKQLRNSGYFMELC
jgi:hypothetical protein